MQSNIRFTVVIPTQNRPQLLILSVINAFNQNYKNFEVIVSDNSTTEEFKQENRKLLRPYLNKSDFKLISPEQELAPPEHFEFALQYAKGDYILFLTDKMILLPETLCRVYDAITETNADIINWTFYAYVTKDYDNPGALGDLHYSIQTDSVEYTHYDPIEHLSYMASGIHARQNATRESYVKGKICFGCYSRGLIEKIIDKSGSLYGGATHDYSASVQALCLAKKCVMLNQPGIIFISLPLDKSLGNLTYFNSLAALEYFQSFKNCDQIIDSLLVPGLYSSQHNMVAHDYIKYLSIHNKRHLFIDKYWLNSIMGDLNLPEKIWSSTSERNSQLNMFNSHLNKNEKIYILYKKISKKLEVYKSESYLLFKLINHRFKNIEPEKNTNAQVPRLMKKTLDLTEALKLLSKKHQHQH